MARTADHSAEAAGTESAEADTAPVDTADSPEGPEHTLETAGTDYSDS